MVKIWFDGDISEIKDVLDLMGIDIGSRCDKAVRRVKIGKCMEGFCVNVNKQSAEILYNTKVDFCRGLSITLSVLENEGTVKIIQKPVFEKCGLMLDVSRGAVMKVETVKDFMRRMARMGFNELLLYTEDVYEMKKYPYFGYMRGRYTETELRAIVEYGEKLGIETVPCIQTLAHLSAPLRWSEFAGMKDQGDILMVGEEDTYSLIEEMVKTVRRCFTTSKIHIGMDEAQGVGLGRYLQKNGYRDRFAILSEHLHRVMELCKKYGFEPMMWSDMFFRLGSPDGGYYNAHTVLPDNISELIPEGITQVYWDYYNYSEKFYNTMIREHKKMGCPIAFAGGIWSFTGPSINNRQTILSTIPALKVCKEQGISHVMAAVWGDDGSECDYYQTLYGLQLFAECNYNSEQPLEKLNEMFEVCNQAAAEAFQLLDVDQFDVPMYSKEDPDFGELHDRIINTSKQVLYQNPLLGMIDKNIEKENLFQHYKDIQEKLEGLSIPCEFKELFETHKSMVNILVKKCDVGIRLKEAYKADKRAALQEIVEELKQIENEFGELIKHRKTLWYKNYKPFGFEPVLIRMTGIQALTRIAWERVEKYLGKELERIEELEQERLLYNSVDRPFFLEYFAKNIMLPNLNE